MNATATKITFPAGITAADLAVNPRTERVYVTIDWETGRVDVIGKHQSEWGTITFRQFHGHQAYFALAATEKIRDLRRWFAAEIVPLAERVVAGYERRWNGDNHVARFTADAAAARQRIGNLFDLRHESLSI